METFISDLNLTPINILIMDSTDPNFYIDGAKRMVAEGIETISKIMAYMKTNQAQFNSLEPTERKKAILEFGPAQIFNQVHPVVFQYLAVEGVFNAKAFRRYVISVFGKPKSQADQARMQKDRKYLYHYKNNQQALYYKYVLLETNSNINKTTIHQMYEEVLSALNADTDRMLDAYALAEKEAKIVDDQFKEEKRTDLLELLRKQTSKEDILKCHP